MTRKALTDLAVQSAKSVKPQTDYFDGLCPGLALRVTKAGRKTWTFKFVSPRDAKHVRIALGSYPAMPLAAARTAAVEARGQVDADTDPRDAKTETQKRAVTIAELFADRMIWEIEGNPDLIWKEVGGKRVRTEHPTLLRTSKKIRLRFEKNILPVVGNMAVKDFEIEDLNRVLDPIRLRNATIECNRVFEDLRSLLKFAMRRGVLKYSVMAASKKPFSENVGERFLTVEEIAVWWKNLPGALAESPHAVSILRLCLLTGQRLSEVAGMKRGEIDTANRLWTIPVGRSKNGYEHKVPLTTPAMEIMGEAMRETNGGYLFPNDAGDGPTLAGRVDKAVDRAMAKFGIPKWTPHALRRTVATHMSLEENGLEISDLIIGAVLNHRSTTKKSVTQRVYNKNEYPKEKRAALEAWAAFLAKVVDRDAEQARAA